MTVRIIAGENGRKDVIEKAGPHDIRALVQIVPVRSHADLSELREQG